MIDVSDKEIVNREATAKGFISLKSTTVDAIREIREGD